MLWRRGGRKKAINSDSELQMMAYWMLQGQSLSEMSNWSQIQRAFACAVMELEIENRNKRT